MTKLEHWTEAYKLINLIIDESFKNNVINDINDKVKLLGKIFDKNDAMQEAIDRFFEYEGDYDE